MGRTGRKRTGGVLVLVTEGKEANKWEKANDNYRWIQNKIALGTDFQYAVDLSPRIIPIEIEPTCEKRFIDPPPENLEPAPAKEKFSRTRKKAPPRKFHMPDGVETGFTTAAKLGGFKNASSLSSKQADIPNGDDEEDDFLLEDVHEEVSQDVTNTEAGLLTSDQEDELKRLYRTVYSGDDNQVVGYPQLDAYPQEQRKLSRTVHLKHGRTTKSFVNMIRNIHDMDDYRIEQFRLNLRPEDKINIPPTPSRHVPSSPFAVVVTNNTNGLSTANVVSNRLTGPALSSIAKLAAFRAPGLSKNMGLTEASTNISRPLTTANVKDATSAITTNGFTSARSMMEGGDIKVPKKLKKQPSTSSSPSLSPSPDPLVERTTTESGKEHHGKSNGNSKGKKRGRAESEDSDDLPTASQLLGKKKTMPSGTATAASAAMKRKSMTVENEKPKKVQVLQRGRQKVISDSDDDD